MIDEGKYPNSYIAGLAWYRDHKKKLPEEPQKETLPVLTLSDVQMRELGAVTAKVKEVSPESAFIEIVLDKPIGRRRAFDAFDGTRTLKPDDEIVVTVRPGQQSVVHILGIREV